MLRLRILCLLSLGACAADSVASPSASPAAAPEASELGAWFGSGERFPDGALCVMFCEGGRLFLGDSPCNRTDRGDFQRYVPYQREGDLVTLAWDKVPQFTFREVDSEHAVLTIVGFQSLPLTRVDESPAWCANEETTRMDRAQR